MLDEPFGALDAITKEELQEKLFTIWAERKPTVLMITHDIDEALFLVDRVVMMTKGPAAIIGEIMELTSAQPRSYEVIQAHECYGQLHNHALEKVNQPIDRCRKAAFCSKCNSSKPAPSALINKA